MPEAQETARLSGAAGTAAASVVLRHGMETRWPSGTAGSGRPGQRQQGWLCAKHNSPPGRPRKKKARQAWQSQRSLNLLYSSECYISAGKIPYPHLISQRFLVEKVRFFPRSDALSQSGSLSLTVGFSHFDIPRVVCVRQLRAELAIMTHPLHKILSQMLRLLSGHDFRYNRLVQTLLVCHSGSHQVHGDFVLLFF